MRDISRRIDAKARPQRAGTAHLCHVRIGRTEDCRPPRDSPLAGEGECDAGARREQRDCGLERASWRRLDRGAREDLFRAQQIEKLGGALLVELHDGPLRDHEAGVSRGDQDRVEVPPCDGIRRHERKRGLRVRELREEERGLAGGALARVGPVARVLLPIRAVLGAQRPGC